MPRSRFPRALAHAARVAVLASGAGLLIFVAPVAAPAADAPGVVVSIQPLHALVAGVMAGVGEPHLVVRGQGSPHTYRMRPSDARALGAARLVVWLGPALETFLVAPLRTISDGAQVLEVAGLPGLIRHRARAGGAWRGPDGVAQGDDKGDDKGSDDGSHDHAHDRPPGGSLDPHLWLDARNAAVIVRAVAERLAALDPPRAARYGENAAAVAARLEALDARLAARLAPARGVPYVVLHDAYQYLERRYGLAAAGAVTVSPDRMPGARRIAALRRRLQALGARCVFGEPQVESGLLESVTEGEPVEVGVLDPLGAGYPPGPDAYFLMMEANAEALAGCLAG